jgi:hypothetical protein
MEIIVREHVSVVMVEFVIIILELAIAVLDIKEYFANQVG